MAGANQISIIPSLAFLEPILQDRTLERVFHDALYPKLLYRMEAMPEKWEAQLGERKIMSRSSLLDVDEDPLEPGVDPQPENESFEQWEVLAAQHGKSSDINGPVNRTTITNLFLRKAKNLGLNGGQTINRRCRNKLFCAYLGGDTITDNAATGVSVLVGSINGFTEQLQNGAVVPVSSSNAKAATIGTDTVSITAAVPTDAANPFGPGTLTVASSFTFVAGERVLASDASLIVRSGGAATVDALGAGDGLALADIRTAVARLRRNNVPVHDDGLYHVHLDPVAENQIFGDTEFQNLNESNYHDIPYQKFAVGMLLGCVFYSNSESPTDLNTGLQIVSRPLAASAARLGRSINAETVNASGVNIIRTIVTGGGALYENYVDEMEYLTEAGTTGQVGGFVVTNNGVAIDIERIRYIVRSPLDRLQQQISQTWSWTGDFGIPSDFLTGDGSRFKRAVVIESGFGG